MGAAAAKVGVPKLLHASAPAVGWVVVTGELCSSGCKDISAARCEYIVVVATWFLQIQPGTFYRDRTL